MIPFGADPATSLPAWSDQDLQTARAMRDDGKSSSEIAAAFGNPRARNTVIGRLARAFGRMPPKSRNPSKRTLNAAAAAERRAERQRAMVERQEAAKTPQTLAERRERAMAKGREIIAKVEAKAAAAQRSAAGLRKFLNLPNPPMPVDDNAPDEIAVDLPPRRYRPVLAADNPGFVAKVEKPWDPYSHMRSEEGLSRALAGLSK